MKRNIFLSLILLSVFKNSCSNEIIESLKDFIRAEQEFLNSLTSEMEDIFEKDTRSIKSKSNFINIDNKENSIIINITIPEELNNEEALEGLDIKASNKKLEGILEHDDSSLNFSVTNGILLSVNKSLKSASENKVSRRSISSTSNTLTLPAKVDTNEATAEVKEGILIIDLPKATQPQDWKKISIKR